MPFDLDKLLESCWDAGCQNLSCSFKAKYSALGDSVP